MHHLTSLGTKKYIFKVYGPMWHTLTSSSVHGAFNSFNYVLRDAISSNMGMFGLMACSSLAKIWSQASPSMSKAVQSDHV